MGEELTSFSELLAGYGTTGIGEGMDVESVFVLLKVRAADGSAAWSVRSGGRRLSSEELLGVLDGLTTSLRQKLMRSWKRSATPERPPAAAGRVQPNEPVAFSDLLAGLETVGLGEDYLIESVFAIIKARRPDGTPVWHARSAEMKLSSEEQMGALEGYAASLRQHLGESWNW